MTAIAVKGLRKRYGSTLAVDDLSFTAEPGRITGFLGPNGAGKTTTLRMVLGLVRPDAGEATIAGRPISQLDAPGRMVGAVLEGGIAHPGRRGRDHLRVFAAAAGLPESRVDEVLATVGLGDVAGKRVKGYSLGMRQRLGVATALLGDPSVLILDEPANGLDPAGMRWLRTLLRGFAAQGGTVLLSSHVLAEVAQTVDDVVVIGHGRCLAQGPVTDFTRDASLEDAYLALTSDVATMR
ncbi:MAG TPA: ATP-binding cassette domain-containing protein [Egibacteraceae bacterium]